MKREEFFEALSDIDEGMVEKAKPYEEPVAPITVTPKRSYLKPLCTAAACVALAAAITAAAVSVTRRPSSVLPPITQNTQEQAYKTSITVVNKSRYPDKLYTYTDDFSDIEIKYIGDEYPNYPKESHYKLYEELAEDSELVVMGTFIDYTGQVTDGFDVPDFAQEMYASSWSKYISFNTLKVEKVLKSNGMVWEGDEIAITQPYVTADGSMYSFSQLTPMIKGDKWVYFLNRNSSYPEEVFGVQSYSPVNDSEGRYPVPDNENAPFQYRENTKGVLAPAEFNEGIYSELKDKLDKAVTEKRPPYEVESQKVTSIADELGLGDSYNTDMRIEFEMGEFEGKVFGIDSGELYLRSSEDPGEIINVIGGPGCYVNLRATYLYDLNGDGKREICTAISLGSGIVHDFVWVRDFFNDKEYVLSKRGETNYSLEKRDGELYLMSWKYPIYYEDRDAKEEPLTLDMLTEIDPNQEQPENTEQSQETEQPSENVFKIMDLTDGYSDYLTDMPLIFDMEEFPGVMFGRDPNGIYGDTLYAEKDGETRTLFKGDGGLSQIYSIYLCDLNGDGKREICVNAADYSGVKYIKVFDYADGQDFTLSDQAKETAEIEYVLNVTDDTLYYSKYTLRYDGDVLVNGGCDLSEPLTLDLMVNTTSLPMGV